MIDYGTLARELQTAARDENALLEEMRGTLDACVGIFDAIAAKAELDESDKKALKELEERLRPFMFDEENLFDGTVNGVSVKGKMSSLFADAAEVNGAHAGMRDLWIRVNAFAEQKKAW